MSRLSRDAIENLSIELDVIVIKSEVKVKKTDPSKRYLNFDLKAPRTGLNLLARGISPLLLDPERSALLTK